MEQLNYCIEELYHMPSLIACENPPGDFLEACEDGDFDNIFPFIENYQEEGERFDREALLQALVDNSDKCFGFLARISTPIKRKTKSGFMHYSWGWTQHEWVHVKDIEDLKMYGQEFSERCAREH